MEQLLEAKKIFLNSEWRYFGSGYLEEEKEQGYASNQDISQFHCRIVIVVTKICCASYDLRVDA